tara:strand:+ start:143 stop:274 length:132 start_codon:yes stop_codon:yes gene_type:complete
MTETLKIIKEYANISDNSWLAIKLELLKEEIELELIKAKQLNH